MEENAAFGSGTSTTKQLKLEVGLSTNTRHGTNKYQKFKSNGRKRRFQKIISNYRNKLQIKYVHSKGKSKDIAKLN